MFTDVPRVVRAAALDDAELEVVPLASEQLLDGDVEVRVLPLHEAPDLEVGVWQHAVGGSRDVEADEVLVVLSGRATIEIEGGPVIEVGPGDLGLLTAGARTTWTIHETLRKVYVLRP